MTIKNILVPADFSPASDEATRIAFDLGRAFHAKVHLLHVYRLPGLPEGSPLSYKNLGDAELAGRRRLDALLESYGDTKAVGEVLVQHGDPYERILACARDLAVQVIVLGTHGRHGLSRVFLGSVAEQIARSAPCSVWIARATNSSTHEAP